jgi:SAM-dependent methyltransferase
MDLPSTGSGAQAGATAGELPWQLKMFSRTLKKQQKLRLLLGQVGATEGKTCLLVTNGDNNGALNWHFRAHGGRWIWVENEPDHIDEMQDLLGEPVLRGDPGRIPLEDGAVDVAVSIDVHEHLEDSAPFNRELFRVTKPGGLVVVTTPNGDLWKPVTVLKRALGMSERDYGHVVYGYNVAQHEGMLRRAGLEPTGSGSYSKFFTELIELAINFAYVKILSRRQEVEVREGEIAPASREQLKAVEKQYRVYSIAYPFLRAIAALDALLPFFTGYAVSVVSRRPA